MHVSPLDLRQQRFRTSFRGYDKVEVTSLLSAAADDYEHALKETDKLKQEVARLEGMLKEQREQEASLKAMLLTATKLGEDIKMTAEEEAKRILREAFRCQLDNKGFSLVEILTMCPTDWYVEPTETPDWIEQNFAPTYPLKVLKSV